MIFSLTELQNFLHLALILFIQGLVNLFLQPVDGYFVGDSLFRIPSKFQVFFDQLQSVLKNFRA